MRSSPAGILALLALGLTAAACSSSPSHESASPTAATQDCAAYGSEYPPCEPASSPYSPGPYYMPGYPYGTSLVYPGFILFPPPVVVVTPPPVVPPVPPPKKPPPPPKHQKPPAPKPKPKVCHQVHDYRVCPP